MSKCLYLSIQRTSVMCCYLLKFLSWKQVILAVATLSSMACAQQATSEDLTLAASKGKRHISQLDPYGSLQFHRPPLPSIDYYGESDKGHGGKYSKIETNLIHLPPLSFTTAILTLP